MISGGAPPHDPGQKQTDEPDSPDVAVISDIIQAALALQFQITERLDSKARNYFAAAATIFGVVQALVLRDDIREQLGPSTDAFQTLALCSAGFLVLTLLAVLWAIRPRIEDDLKSSKLRDLLNRAYTHDAYVPGEAANRLIGLLDRRKAVNRERAKGLAVVMGLAATTGGLAVAQLVLVVQAVL